MKVHFRMIQIMLVHMSAIHVKYMLVHHVYKYKIIYKI